MKPVDLNRAIEILRHHGRSFDSLMADKTHAFFLHSMDGTVLAVNDVACEKLRYTREQLLGLTIDKWEKNFDLAQIVNYWPRLPVNTPLKFFGIHIRSDGGQFPVAMDAWVLDHGGDRILYSLVRDMTMTDQVIENLQRSELRFHTIFDNAQEAIFIQEMNGALLDANRKACEMLGYTHQELMTLAPTEWLLLGNIRQSEIQDTLKAGKPCEIKAALRYKDGHIIPVESNLAILNLDEKSVILAMARDISERVKHEEEVSRLLQLIAEDNVQLRKLSQMKDNFLSMASHELRTPLTSIIGYIKLVLGPAGPSLDDANRQDFLQTALSNADRLLNLVNDLLDMSRLEDGRLALHREETAVRSVMENASKSLDVLVAQKAIVLESGDVPDEWRASWDAGKVERVLINLLANAVKFSPKGGGIQTHVVRESRDGRMGYCFHIADQGPGIPPEYLQRIFEKFYQVENPLTRKAGGTGLGLAIAKGIVDSHDGIIWAENGPRGGTLMQFFLPER